MKEFEELLKIAEILHGPEGCIWDRKQTFQSLQKYVLEEAYEVLEAVDSDEDQQMIEELGDLLYTIVFYAKIAQRLGRFSMKEILDCENEKLIRRHPHVFGDLKISSEKELEEQWNEIKKQEKGKEDRTNVFSGIPRGMPLIARSQKSLSYMETIADIFFENVVKEPISERELGDRLLSLIYLSQKNGWDAESALRRSLQEKEALFLKKTQIDLDH